MRGQPLSNLDTIGIYIESCPETQSRMHLWPIEWRQTAAGAMRQAAADYLGRSVLLSKLEGRQGAHKLSFSCGQKKRFQLCLLHSCLIARYSSAQGFVILAASSTPNVKELLHPIWKYPVC